MATVSSAIPFFCADCEGELKPGHVERLKDGRYVCDKCKRKIEDKRERGRQRDMFVEQDTLFNPQALTELSRSQQKRRRNVEGYTDESGFHPIRASEDYNEFLAGDFDKRERKPTKKEQREIDEWEKRELESIREAEALSGAPTKTLAQFVRAMGGIVPGGMFAGEIRRLGFKETGTTGLINQKARQGAHKQTAEYVMDAANTEGYRDRHGERFTAIGDFLTAVEESAVKGIDHFRARSMTAKQSREKRLKKAMTHNPEHSDQWWAAQVKKLFTGGYFLSKTPHGGTANSEIASFLLERMDAAQAKRVMQLLGKAWPRSIAISNPARGGFKDGHFWVYARVKKSVRNANHEPFLVADGYFGTKVRALVEAKKTYREVYDPRYLPDLEWIISDRPLRNRNPVKGWLKRFRTERKRQAKGKEIAGLQGRIRAGEDALLDWDDPIFDDTPQAKRRGKIATKKRLADLKRQEREAIASFKMINPAKVYALRWQNTQQWTKGRYSRKADALKEGKRTVDVRWMNSPAGQRDILQLWELTKGTQRYLRPINPSKAVTDYLEGKGLMPNPSRAKVLAMTKGSLKGLGTVKGYGLELSEASKARVERLKGYKERAQTPTVKPKGKLPNPDSIYQQDVKKLESAIRKVVAAMKRDRSAGSSKANIKQMLVTTGVHSQLKISPGYVYNQAFDEAFANVAPTLKGFRILNPGKDSIHIDAGHVTVIGKARRLSTENPGLRVEHWVNKQTGQLTPMFDVYAGKKKVAWGSLKVGLNMTARRYENDPNLVAAVEKATGAKVRLFEYQKGRKGHVKAIGRKNPGVKAIADKFQGQANGALREMYAATGAPANLARAGKLVFLKVNGRTIRIPGAMVAISPSEKLWITGERKAALFSTKAKPGEGLDFGEVSHICYETGKKHIDNGKRYEYVHEFGEDGGKRPHLIIDSEGMPILRGGDYKIKAEGIVN